MRSGSCINRVWVLLFVFFFTTLPGTNKSIGFAQEKNSSENSFRPASFQSDTTAKDSANLILPTGQVKKVVKRDFNPKQQVLIGTLIMSLLLVIITTNTNWNP
jgi:hypothetical protein